MELKKHYRKSPSMVARRIAEELVLVPTKQNEVGARTRKLIENERTLEYLLPGVQVLAVAEFKI